MKTIQWRNKNGREFSVSIPSDFIAESIAESIAEYDAFLKEEIARLQSERKALRRVPRSVKFNGEKLL